MSHRRDFLAASAVLAAGAGLTSAAQPEDTTRLGRTAHTRFAVNLEMWWRNVMPFTRRIEEAARLLVDRRIRRLPVMAQGRMVGLLSRSDVLDFFASSQWTCQACGQGYRGLEAPSACDFCSGTDFRLERGSLAPGT